MFRHPSVIKKNILSAIIWPPAQNVSDNIYQELRQHYHIVKDVSFTVENRNLLNFVKMIYKKDRRCDKSKLPFKTKTLIRPRLQIRFIKFVVKDLDLNDNNVSNTAIGIKKIIRNKYKNYVENYNFDNIFHVSDNMEHSLSMEQTVANITRK